MSDAGLDEHIRREDPKHIPDRVRREVLDRDGNQCTLCGVGGENRLQLHHVVYRSQGGRHTQENLITVCVRCHNDIHHGRAAFGVVEREPGDLQVFPTVRTLLRPTT